MHQDQGEVPPLKTKTQANNYVLFSQNGVKQIKDENTARERNEYWILTLTCMRAKKESYIFGVRRRRIVFTRRMVFILILHKLRIENVLKHIFYISYLIT